MLGTAAVHKSGTNNTLGELFINSRSNHNSVMQAEASFYLRNPLLSCPVMGQLVQSVILQLEPCFLTNRVLQINRLSMSRKQEVDRSRLNPISDLQTITFCIDRVEIYGFCKSHTIHCCSRLRIIMS